MKDKIKKLKFIHITKTAGTAIEELGILFNVKWGRHDKDIELLTSHLEYIQDKAFWHVPTIYYNLELLHKIKEKYDFFLIVRNPYDRVISEFYCKWGGYKSKHFEKFYKLKINENSSNDNINKWINMRLNHLKELLEKNKYLVNGHWNPHYLYIYDSTGKSIVKKNNVIHFENLENELNELFKRYNTNIDYLKAPEINKNKKKFKIEDLSIKNIKLINEIYHKDFKLFGYKKI